VAGQSNVLNWHADAALLPADAHDKEIRFFHHSGAPPAKGGAQPFNATSGGQWVALGPQRQEPHVRYARDFFGPEISLARTLAPGEASALAVIKTAYFGSNLAEDWRPDATGGNRLYGLMLAQVREALAKLAERGETPRLAGFFWMQGETDAGNATHAATYEANLRAFIARLRKDLNAPDLPVVLGRIGPRPPRGYVHSEIVRQAQVRVATGLPRVTWVDTDDLPRDTDGIHLTARGVIALGERWADAWDRLK
jgi:lysophospholipase L1-like esterase